MFASLARSPARRLAPRFARLLYTARWPGAILVAALVLAAPVRADFSDISALREGDMRKLSFHAEPRPVPAATMTDAEDAPRDLSDWHGQWVVLNFWATWCAPCRHEMPALDALQAELGDKGVSVLPVATGRNPLPAITRFYDDTGLEHLPILRDPTQAMSRAMGVLGLPVTVILNPEGDEIARMTGDADWAGPSALAILRALVEQGQ